MPNPQIPSQTTLIKRSQAVFSDESQNLADREKIGYAVFSAGKSEQYSHIIVKYIM